MEKKYFIEMDKKNYEHKSYMAKPKIIERGTVHQVKK